MKPQEFKRMKIHAVCGDERKLQQQLSKMCDNLEMIQKQIEYCVQEKYSSEHIISLSKQEAEIENDIYKTTQDIETCQNYKHLIMRGVI